MWVSNSSPAAALERFGTSRDRGATALRATSLNNELFARCDGAAADEQNPRLKQVAERPPVGAASTVDPV